MTSARSRARGFSLMETVIAIGVLAVLLTAFLSVFGPAATGIRKTLSSQEADRLASTLERELQTLRSGQSPSSGFDKAFIWIKESVQTNGTLFVYQYRGNPDASKARPDGTMEPYTTVDGVSGKDYIVQTMLRRRDDSLFEADLKALEGRVFAVKATQLIFNNGALKPGTAGQIVDPKGGSTVTSSSAYPDAVISFAADFFEVVTTSPAYLKQGGAFDPAKQFQSTPMFTRNLAVSR